MSGPVEPTEGDDFPGEGEGTETIKYMVGTRFAEGPATGRAVPGHLLGELISRVSRLYSALRDGGENLSRAVDNHPFAYDSTAYRQSIDVFLAPAAREDGEQDLEPDDAPSDLAIAEDALKKLRELTAAQPDDIAAVAAEFGGAVATAYRQLASLLGQRGVSASFFTAGGTEPCSDLVRLGVPTAAAHAERLSDQAVLRRDTARLVGVLDELAGGRGVFKLIRPADLPERQQEAWREAVRSVRSIEGQLTDEAATDVRRLNAWSSRVEVELALTFMTSPKSTRAEEVTAELVRVITVQPQLGSD